MQASESPATVALPLSGRTIVVTRPAEQSGDLIERLRALGATPVECAAISIAPLTDYTQFDAALSQLATYDWVVFTSVNGVSAFASRMQALGLDPSLLHNRKVAAIGPATGAALAEYGCMPDFVPDSYVAEAIVAQIGDVKDCRVLLPRADIARKALAAGLRDKGATVDEIDAYRTVSGQGIAELAGLLTSGSVDAVTFTSSSTARYTIDGLVAAGLDRTRAIDLLNKTALVCIGPITAKTALESGLKLDAVADEYTTHGLVDALVQLFAAKEKRS